MQEVSLGQYALPFLIAFVLGIIYKFVNIPDRFKALIAVFVGIGLAIVAMFYNVVGSHSFQLWVDYILYGVVSGAGASGVYEVSKSFKPQHRT